ncbi:MAG: pyridoxal phosphate-dependent aminotransferase [Leptospirales bacterium]
MGIGPISDDPAFLKGDWDHGGAPVSGTWKDDRILDSSTTINPFGPPFSLAEALSVASRRFDRYPDPWGSSSIELLSGFLGVPAENLVVGPGSTSLIYRWMEVVRPKRLVLFEPIFSEYRRAAMVFGIPCVTVPPSVGIQFEGVPPPEGSGKWGVDLSTLFPFRRGDQVVLVNPVNPTGQEFSRPALLNFWNMVSSNGGGLLIDESFQDFLPEQSSLLSETGSHNPGLFILRSLTKATGLPGIRTGWLAGSREIIGAIRQRVGPWPIGSLEESIIYHWTLASVEAPAMFKKVRDARRDLSDRLVLLGWKVAVGASPFLFVFTGWGDLARERQERLFQKSGLYLRVAGGFGPPSGTDYIRLGFGAFREPDRIVTDLTESS